MLTPEPASFVPEQADGYPPLIDVVTGTETWDVNDVTAKFDFGGFLKGTDTHTTFGSITNDDLIVPSAITFTDASGQLILTQGTEIDVVNFGGGFENQWLDIPGTGVTDLFITPFGDVNIPL